jgi:hypothetical protein
MLDGFVSSHGLVLKEDGSPAGLVPTPPIHPGPTNGVSHLGSYAIQELTRVVTMQPFPILQLGLEGLSASNAGLLDPLLALAGQNFKSRIRAYHGRRVT